MGKKILKIPRWGIFPFSEELKMIKSLLPCFSRLSAQVFITLRLLHLHKSASLIMKRNKASWS